MSYYLQDVQRDGKKHTRLEVYDYVYSAQQAAFDELRLKVPMHLRDKASYCISRDRAVVFYGPGTRTHSHSINIVTKVNEVNTVPSAPSAPPRETNPTPAPTPAQKDAVQ